MAAPKLVTKRCHFPEGLKGEQGPHVGELGDVVPEQIAIVAARLLVDMECHEAPERDGPPATGATSSRSALSMSAEPTTRRPPEANAVASCAARNHAACSASSTSEGASPAGAT